MKIIVVDPNGVDLKSTIMAIRRLFSNIELMMFLSSKEASKYIQDNPIDFMFTEINMKGLDGFALMDKLRTFQPGAKTVFITSSKELALIAMEKKAYDFILKPINDSDILQVLS